MLNHNLIKKIFDELAFIHLEDHKERMKLVFDELNEFEHSYEDDCHSFAREIVPKHIVYAYNSESFHDIPDKYTSYKRESYKREGQYSDHKYIHIAPNDSILYKIWKDGQPIEDYTVDLLAEGEKKN